MSNRASSDTLDGLHALLAEAQAEALARNLERSRLPKDNKDYEPLDTKLVSAAAKFLKDNGVDAPATSPRFSTLVDQLSSLNVDELPAN